MHDTTHLSGFRLQSCAPKLCIYWPVLANFRGFGPRPRSSMGVGLVDFKVKGRV